LPIAVFNSGDFGNHGNYGNLLRLTFSSEFSPTFGSQTLAHWNPGMNLKHKFSARHQILLIAMLTLVSATEAFSQDAATQTKAEIERLRQSLKDKPVSSPDLPGAAAMIDAALRDAAAAQATGHLYSSLERLGQAEDLFQGARTIDEKGETILDSMPAFESAWNTASLRLARLDQQARARNWSRRPAAIRALAEAAQGRALPLLEGSRGFASSTKPRDGLLYMGESQGQAEFSSFLYALDVQRKGAPFPLRSLLPELQALQERTNAAFQPPRSIEMHPRFIALNGTLKFARELDAAQAYAGALYQYLEATRHFGMLEAAAPDAARQSELKSKIEQELKKIAVSRRDDSVAQIFLERAAAWINKPDGSATSPDEWKSAAVIVEQVLPAYYGALQAARPRQQRAGKTATLTLVRWPYT
jgi:hypothetical protein